MPAQVRERRSLGVREPRRPGYREVLADRRFTALNATTVIFGLCLLGLPLILVLYVTRTLGQPTWVAGALLAGNTALIVTLQTPVTEALRPLRGTRLLRLASVLFGASFALLWAAHASGTRWIVLCLVTGVACYTAAEIIASPVLTDLVATLAPTGLRGRYFALSQICWSLAAVLGPSVFTRLMNIGTVPLWGTLLVVSVGAFVLVSRHRGRPRHLPHPHGGPSPDSKPPTPPTPDPRPVPTRSAEPSARRNGPPKRPPAAGTEFGSPPVPSALSTPGLCARCSFWRTTRSPRPSTRARPRSAGSPSGHGPTWPSHRPLWPTDQCQSLIFTSCGSVRPSRARRSRPCRAGSSRRCA